MSKHAVLISFKKRYAALVTFVTNSHTPEQEKGMDLHCHREGAARTGPGTTFRNLLMKWRKRGAIEKGKVVFYSFSEGYSCNPRAICDEMLRRGSAARLVWVSEKKGVNAPEGVSVVSGKRAMRRALSTAHVIVSNSRLGHYWACGYQKKPGQVYIQTWHGSFGIKKMEGDVEKLPQSYLNRARVDSSNIDYLLSNSRWLTERFRESFFYEGEILETGSPRNDVLQHAGSQQSQERATRVRRICGLRHGERIALVAPTFREGGVFPPLPDMRRLRDALASKFGGEWIVLLHMHPGFRSARTRPPRNKIVSGGDVLDVSFIQDVMDLLLVADVMVSDYSSCIFDFLPTGRPGFLYAPDLDEYERARGLYYPLCDVPFPVAETDERLAQAICSFDEGAYRKRVESFLHDKGAMDDGHASERVADLIENILAEKEVQK